MEALWIGIAIVIVVGVGILIMKKFVKFAIGLITIVLLCGLVIFGTMQYLNLTMNDVKGYQQMASAVKGWDAKFDYDFESKTLSVIGENYELQVIPGENGKTIKGSSSLQNKEAVQTLMGLFLVGAEVFNLEEINSTGIENLNSDQVAGYFVEGVYETLSDPDKYMKAIEGMQNSGKPVEFANFKMYVENDKLFIVIIEPISEENSTEETSTEGQVIQ